MSDVQIIRYGSSSPVTATIRWSGIADVDGDADVPVALAVDAAGRDIAIARNLSVPTDDPDAFFDLVGHRTRGWTTVDGEDPADDLCNRINAALNP